MPSLQRYISDELTHFVGRGCLPDIDRQFEILIKILKGGWLTHPPHDPKVSGNLRIEDESLISENAMYSPDAVCFCDIPRHDLWFHAQKYGRCGLSFKKQFLVGKGASPVFYIAKNSSVSMPADLSDNSRMEDASRRIPVEGAAALMDVETRGAAFDKQALLIRQLLEDLQVAALKAEMFSEASRFTHIARFQYFQVFAFMKFFDASKPEDDPENYYMEREWRVLGNLQFSLADVACVMIPGAYCRRLRDELADNCGEVVFIDS
jgi:hypothetical protein